MSFDQSLFTAVFSLARASSFLDIVGIFFARYLAYVVFAAFILFVVLERNWKKRLYVAVLPLFSVALSYGIVTQLLRFLVDRDRPPIALALEPLIPMPNSPAFPSGHAAIFFTLAMALLYLNRRWGIWFFAAAALIAVARVFVGVHWPLDVVAGAIIGVVSAYAAHRLLPAPVAEKPLSGGAS